MDAVFLTLLNMSINASWIVLATVILRLLLRKAPKWLICILWAFAALRLMLPFSVESIFSIIPSSETVSPNIIYEQTPAINSGIPFLNSAVNPIISESFSPTVNDSANPLQTITAVAAVIWLIGMVLMLLYSLISCLRLRLRVREAIVLDGNILQSDRIDTPFILGVIRPRIYLPSDMSSADADFVIAHETAHLRRFDHLWKPLGFLLLSVYWFNPVLWIAYILLCRDIEFACDEKVIKERGESIKRIYSEALINCSVTRRSIAACPIAFGEVGVKKRIKNILSYKKPAFWMIIIAVILCIATAVCFLTDSKTPQAASESESVTVLGTESDRDDVSIRVTELKADNGRLILTIEWLNNSDDTVFYGERFKISVKNDNEWKEIETNAAWVLVAYPVAPSPQSTDPSFIWSTNKEYVLSDYCDFTSVGVYRFSTDYYFDSDHDKRYSVSADFELSKPVMTCGEQASKVTEMIEYGLDALGIGFDTEPETDSYILSSKSRAIELKDRTDSLIIYRFGDEASAVAARSRIAEDGSFVAEYENRDNMSLNIEPLNPPHWYGRGCVLVCYRGFDSDIMALMNSVCSRQFAGYVQELSSPDTGVLRDKYPEFFGLDDSEGLVVYVWQMAEYSYKCSVVSSATDAISDQSFAFTKGATVSEMKSILSTYATDNVELRPVINPISSYYYVIDDAYTERVQSLFGGLLGN